MLVAAGLGDADLQSIRQHLREGGVLVYPTDTLYALGGLARDPVAAHAVLAIKGRPDGKALPVVAADEAAARGLAAEWTDVAATLARRFWPGPLTLVVPAVPAVPIAVTGGTGTLALRVPDLALTRSLCALAGPLIATSANLSGRVAPLTCAQALAGLGGAVSLAVDGGPGRPLPSTIVDATSRVPRLLREGAIAWDAVRAALRID